MATSHTTRRVAIQVSLMLGPGAGYKAPSSSWLIIYQENQIQRIIYK